MTGDARSGRQGKPALSADDLRLWESVTRGVKPLRARAAASVPADATDAAPPPPSPRARSPAASAVRAAAPPPLAGLGRRDRQRIARGVVAIEARIDLHGLTQERAHRTLLRFLRDSQANGLRHVLVITGKGAPEGASPERGVLRRVVPQWLALPELRLYVVGFEPAHAAHGGEGALYVRVRRRRAP